MRPPGQIGLLDSGTASCSGRFSVPSRPLFTRRIARIAHRQDVDLLPPLRCLQRTFARHLVHGVTCRNAQAERRLERAAVLITAASTDQVVPRAAEPAASVALWRDMFPAGGALRDAYVLSPFLQASKGTKKKSTQKSASAQQNDGAEAQAASAPPAGASSVSSGVKLENVRLEVHSEFHSQKCPGLRPCWGTGNNCHCTHAGCHICCDT